MKRVLSLLAAGTLLLALTLLSGCGNKDTGASSVSGNTAATTAATAAATAGINADGNYQNGSYVVLGAALSNEQYGVGFRKADQALRDEVQKQLCAMKADGKLATITTKWFGKDSSTVPDTFTPGDDADGSLDKVKTVGVFKLGLDDSFPPMGYQDADGNIVGYDIDLATEVCARMGVTLKLVPIDWNSKELELNNGNIDCIWNGFTITDERSAAFNMTEPYLDNRQVVVTTKDSGITDMAGLAGKSVVYQSGSTAQDAIEATENAAIKNSIKSLSEVDNNVNAMFELQQGISDAVIMDEVVAMYYINHLTEMQAAANGG